MTKNTVTELDVLMASFVGSPADYPYSSSETYIGRVKRQVIREGLFYHITYNPTTNKIVVAISTPSKDGNVGTQWVSDGYEYNQEPMAFCKAVEKYLAQKNAK